MAQAEPPPQPSYPPLPAGATIVGQERVDGPVHRPISAKVLDLPNLGVSTVAANPPISLGNDQFQCTYRSPNSGYGAWNGAAGTWSYDTNAYNHYGSQDLRSTGFFGATETATYAAEIGQALVFNGGGFVRATVEYPWSYKGDIALLSQFSAVPAAGGFSRGTITMKFLVDLMRDDVSTALEVDYFTVTANRGLPVEANDITNSGYATRTVGVTGAGETLRSAFRVQADLETETQALTNARASFDFSLGDNQGWKLGPTQNWLITMQPGYVLADCG